MGTGVGGVGADVGGVRAGVGGVDFRVTRFLYPLQPL